ncbi:M56 family metallopeptidase [Kordia sp.]|uniref:M56 family metallopeptidase n=1 Tax=Kordia sp. TaxID=1965332 RepID=UPI0025B7F0B3|nr:M56 family metallopeptidase [Kordia sp.]MCH2192901.1 M56 family metallopeptidase [Kordia sp.]
MMAYFIQVVAFQLLFLLSYDLFLKKETFFNWNRVYLIFSSLISFLLPFIKIESFQNVVPQEYIILLPEIMLTPEKAVATIEPTWNWFLIIGFSISSLLFIYKVVQLVKLRFKGRFVKHENYTMIIIPESTIAFSIFRYVFLGNDIHEEKLEDILSHELVHIREKHSLDLLYFELLRILCWFNPLVYIYQKRISEVHEYIADAIIVKGKNKSDYYEKLLAEVFQTQQFSFTNQFFKHSLIKKRIIMLTKQKSRQILKLKYLVLIPLLVVALIYTSCDEAIFSDTENTTAQTVTLDKKAAKEKITRLYERVNEINRTLKSDEVLTREAYEEQAEIMTEVAGLVDEDGTLAKTYETQSYEEYVDVRKKRIAEAENTNKRNKPNKKAEVASKEDSDETYSFKEVDKLPIYPGCETLGSQEEIKKCLTENIQKHVLHNFNMKMVEESKLKGKQKIQSRFIIDKNGKVQVAEVKAPNTALKNETERVIKSLPMFKPAQKDGKSVGVKYGLPITFKVQE